jgi:hypothetical protein
MDQQVFVGPLILVIFLIAAAIMFTRKLPALIVLPGMALAIVAGTALLTGQISMNDITGGVISRGAIRLHEPIIIAFFGGILSFIMQKSGVAESLVKNGAELIGDNPFMVSVFSLGLIALLFTSIGGLGAIIMVSMVVLPMLATVGVPPAVAGGIMLIGISLGGILNAGNWVLYTSVMGLSVQQVQQFALVVFFLTALAGLVFISIELYRAGTIRSLAQTLSIIGGVAAVGAGVIWMLVGGRSNAEESIEVAAGVPFWKVVARVGFGALIGLIILIHLLDIRTRIRRWRHQVVRIQWYAYLIPILPLVLIIIFDTPILAAFLAGFVYAVFVTVRPGFISLSIQSMIQGSSTVMPAVLLMIGIGILLNAVLGPPGWSAANEDMKWPVLAAIEPMFQRIIPANAFAYVLIFGLAAPLALYRGPLNVWGLGYGVAALLLASNQMPAAAIMAMLLTVGQVQGICDPTNTHNVWLANELRVDVQTLMWRTLPYIWGMVFVGLAVAGAMYASEWPSPEEARAALEMSPVPVVVESAE